MATSVKPSGQARRSAPDQQRPGRDGREAPASATNQPAATVGLWAALAATALTSVFVVLAAVSDSPEWAGLDSYARVFATAQVIQLIPVLLLAPVVVVLVACIHGTTPTRKQLFSLVGLAFATIYAAIIAVNYVVQLFVVRLNLAAGDLEGLALLAMPNPRSVFVALETVGYGFFALMALFVAVVFSGSMLGAWIRGLLLATGVAGLAGTTGALLDESIVMLSGFGLSLVAFLLAAALLTVYFWRTSQTLLT